MPIYEYECLECGYRFEEHRPFDNDPDKCPECGGKIKRLLSMPTDYLGVTSGFSTRGKKPAKVKGTSGKLGRRVSETDSSNIIEGQKVDSKGRPHFTPTRPKPAGRDS